MITPRVEQDSPGPVAVPADQIWGAQTQRPPDLIRRLAASGRPSWSTSLTSRRPATCWARPGGWGRSRSTGPTREGNSFMVREGGVCAMELTNRGFRAEVHAETGQLDPPGPVEATFFVNGVRRTLRLEPRVTLLDAL